MLSPLATALRAALCSAEIGAADFPFKLDAAQRVARVVTTATSAQPEQKLIAGRVGGILLTTRSMDIARHRPVIVARLRHLLGDVVEAVVEADYAMPPMPVPARSNVLAFPARAPRYLWPECSR